MAEYQRQVNTLVTFKATTNATIYQWKINNIVVSTNVTYQRIFTQIGFYTIEFTGTNTCNDKCIQTFRLEIVSQPLEKPPQITIGDYTVETRIETPIYRSKKGTTERIAEESTTILGRIENIEIAMLDIMQRRVNFNTHYYIDTSSTSRRKIDVTKDIGVPASELYIISEGGGFTLEINDEGYAINVRSGFKITDERIERIYVAGTGTAGTGRVRIGTWRQ